MRNNLHYLYLYEATVHVLAAFSVELDGDGRALVSTIVRGMKEPYPNELRSRPLTGTTAAVDICW